MAKYVSYFLGNGIMTPRTRRETNEDLEIGTLVALDENGKLVKATNASSGAKRAIGVITTGSVADLDSPRYYKGSNILKKGDFQEVYKYFTVGNVPSTEVDFGTAKLGDPVYLGEDGKMTTTKPSGGAMIQVVGLVGDKTRQEVECTLIFPTETSV